ncbi:hypothetical protein ACWEKR_06025 [Nocardia sp. NPDC004573]
MTEGPELDEVEVELDDASELIWRNVNPAWIQDGKVSSQAFRPTPKDKQQLSGAREQKVTAEKHFHEFTQELELRSVGVWAVSVGEANAQDVRCVYDAESADAPDPCPTGHTYLDFRAHMGDKAIRRVGRLLSEDAQRRGRMHPNQDG